MLVGVDSEIIAAAITHAGRSVIAALYVCMVGGYICTAFICAAIKSKN